FAPMLIESNALYKNFFEIFNATGAIAWGITGSGASMFALYPEGKFISPFMDRIKTYDEFIDLVIMS
ncbi:MAG: hypothetical protein FWG09_00755, partial [Synergistaceae bacterium]|nr:hypothetical protein [Synergistaceae bacterium]